LENRPQKWPKIGVFPAADRVLVERHQQFGKSGHFAATFSELASKINRPMKYTG
jgi:hypothetical protein